MIGKVISALAWCYHHKEELEEAAEFGIHVYRRLELLTDKHNATIDEALVAADKALGERTPEDGKPQAQ